MDPITSLLLLFLAQGKGGGASQPRTRSPAWPTPSSPPPMPAFKPQVSPSADATQTSTPLAELHASPPSPPRATTDATRPKAAPRTARVPRIVPGMLTSTLPVQRLQQALNARGAKLVPDGLYGPKTAAAWAKMATSKGLPGMITRKAPTLADVATHTFDALSLPAIP